MSRPVLFFLFFLSYYYNNIYVFRAFREGSLVGVFTFLSPHGTQTSQLSLIGPILPGPTASQINIISNLIINGYISVTGSGHKRQALITLLKPTSIYPLYRWPNTHRGLSGTPRSRLRIQLICYIVGKKLNAFMYFTLIKTHYVILLIILKVTSSSHIKLFIT